MPKRPIKTASLQYEHQFLAEKGASHIVGFDEVGRGAWAGPVVVGAVCLPIDQADLTEKLAGVRDSKQLTPRQRTHLVETIKVTAIAWGIGSATNGEIDQMGIMSATRLAMRRAYEHLIVQQPEFTPEAFFLDAITWIDAPVNCEQLHLTKGDQRSLSIAAASILAKTYRDHWMRELEQNYPGYDFALHKGYGTAKHRAALTLKGLTPVHRVSFKPMGGTLL
ncbi:MAG: ribonuclease HII [Anaerolineae bacterium]|jgi:ribonuclease HII|nr:ribonuclease HII [Anaerolineae bacterium]